MVTLVKMPKSSLTMEEGTILKWYKKEGDTVEKGEPLVQIMEEKSTIDLEATSSGVVKKLYYEEQTDVPVGRVIAAVGSPEEKVPEVDVEKKASKEDVKPIKALEAPEPKAVKGVVKASPLAKKIAKEHGIDLTLIKGTGPGGRVTEKDIKSFMERRVVPLTIERRVKEVIPLTGFRRIIAERMSLSARTHPKITIFMDVDFTELKRFRERLKNFEGLEISYTDMIVKAAAKALSRHPMINSSVEGDEIRIYEDINVGVAVATDLGLVVPVVHGADKKALREISSEVVELVDKARRNALTKKEMSNGTFTVTNLGMFDVDSFTPLINPPECAILGVGRLSEKAMVYEGRLEARLTSTLSLSFDHRVVDGVPAAKFLKTVKSLLEGPELE